MKRRFTANLLDRRNSLLTDQIEALREATRRARERHPFHIDAFVVLPDHHSRDLDCEARVAQ